MRAYYAAALIAGTNAITIEA
jgi:hypothetical protein